MIKKQFLDPITSHKFINLAVILKGIIFISVVYMLNMNSVSLMGHKLHRMLHRQIDKQASRNKLISAVAV